jgi:hypothetical protein
MTASGAHGRGSPTTEDLELLAAAVDLTPRRVNVPARRVFEHRHGRPPGPTDLVELRMAVLRLERDGLLRSDAALNVEPTPDGQVAAGLVRARRDGRQPPADPSAN